MNSCQLRITGIDGLLSAARAQVRELTPAVAEAALDDFLVIDVREPSEVLEGYLPGAVGVPRGTIEFRAGRDARFANRQRAILVYSNAGERSVLAALTLGQLGFSDVCSLAGGIRRWAAENRPIH